MTTPPVPPAVGEPPLTDAELAEIEARAEAATSGPWQVEASSDQQEITTVVEGFSIAEVVCDDEDPAYLAEEPTAEAAFIAAARTDVPRLVAALRAAREERDQAQGDRDDNADERDQVLAMSQEIADTNDLLRAAVARAERAAADARQLQLQREELLLMCDGAELVGNGLIPTGEIRKAFARTRALAADVPAAADHTHPGGYLSTACLHELHEPECGAAQRARGDHSHPHCKFCDSPCVCSCHTGHEVDRAQRVHVDGCTLAADEPHHAGWCVLSVGAVSGSGEATTTTDGE